MKIRRIKVLLANGWCKVVCFVSFSLLSVICNHASAQKAGDMISGVVSDKEGPMALVNVTQRDSLDRIVARSITDREGKFTFPLLNPGNTIKVTYLGYEPVNLPINKQYYEIRLNELPGNEVYEISAAFAAGESKSEFGPIIVDPRSKSRRPAGQASSPLCRYRPQNCRSRGRRRRRSGSPG